jgi:serine/threonine protein kinase/Tol biopolymer transport system component
MNADRWRQISQLYDAALQRGAGERAAFVREACAGDVALQQDVELLLADESRAARFLSEPAAGIAARMMDSVAGSTLTGRRLGVYQLQTLLGAGGMGEVYRARDTRLGRDVAIKILPRIFTANPDRLARFEREARMLASLNHPNIGAIYGVEEEDGILALVLELAEGPTLADRLAKGPLPVREALSIATQIADALDAAHERGIVHRDLKPANVVLTIDGHMKVLDFGLAKVATGDQAGPDLTQSPTMTIGGTREGIILGTAAYMSPEQARGQAVDKRTDIWAFGCVLYEMLTGRAAFAGDSVSEILARVLEREPDWTAIPAPLQPRIHELLRRCLEKDPKKRRRDVGDIRVEIEQILSGPAQTAPAIVDVASRRRAGLVWAVAAVLAAALVVTVARPYFSRPAEAPETIVDVSTPDTPDPTSFAISADGRRLVFVAFRNGQPQLYLRSLDADTAQPLNGTELATLPFWSPDGRSIGFFASGQLRRIDIEGGLLQTLATASTGAGGTWGPDGTILFAPTLTGPVFRMPASGDELPIAVTKLEAGQSSHRLPVFLPGGRQFLFYATTHGIGPGDARGIYLGSLDSTVTTRLMDADTTGGYLSPGWLLYALQGALVARRFDLARQKISGDPVIVAESAAVTGVHGGFAMSATGVIGYRAGGTSPRQLTWFDRSGKVLGTLGEPDRADLWNPAVSRDGRRVAVQRTVKNNLDIWFVDPVRASRFTNDPGIELYPTWSPDGLRVAFTKTGRERADLYERASSGSGKDELLYSSPWLKFPTDWSLDGRFLMYFEAKSPAGPDLWVLPMNGEHKPFLFLDISANKTWGQFSPDGRWVAYQSNESGRFEIYVRPFPPGPGGGQWPVSSSGGTYPKWRPDGKELFYLAPGGGLMAATIAAKGATLEVGTPVALFQTRIAGGGAMLVGSRQQYDVARDGRFLINVETESTPPPITLVWNWKPKR